MSYSIKNSRGDLIAMIDEKGVDRTSTSLVLHGRGASPYGTDRNRNIVRLLENFSSTTPPNNPMDGQLWWNTVDLQVWDTSGSPSAWRAVVPPSAGLGFDVVAGAGLTGGGFPAGSPLSVTINVGAGTGITVQGSPGLVSTNDSQIVHDNLSGFVANEHIDHSAITIGAGKGLFGSPTTIDSNVTINVGQGDGISVSANQVDVDSTVVLTSTAQQIDSIKIFTAPIVGATTGTSAATPAYGFGLDTDNGIYRSGTNELSFSTGATQRFRIESGGVLRSLNSTYESLVTSDDIIPNKKYVDDLSASGGFPTGNIFVGTSSISGLNPNETYLVNGYGTMRSAGTSTHYMYPLYLRRGSTTPGVGTIVAQTPGQNIDWPDGAAPVTISYICEMSGDTAVNFYMDSSGSTPDHGPALYMTAMQISSNTGGSPIVGSPLPSVGTISLASLPATKDGASVAYGLYYPLAAVRIESTGEGKSAAGSTAAILVYTQFGSDWLLSGGPASSFEVFVTDMGITGSNAITWGTTGAWLPITSTRSYTLERFTVAPGTCTWTLGIEIREIANPGNTTGSHVIVLSAEQII